MISGALNWRDGEWDEAAAACRRAHELGEQVGRSEIAFAALFWLAAVLRDSGDYSGAESELARALDLCERAGLIPQSLEATTARAVALALGGRGDAARGAAEEAERLTERLSFPIGEAATGEASGAAAENPADGAEFLAVAAEAWDKLGRPLDAARCLALRAKRLSEAEAEDADAARAEAEQRAGELGLGAHTIPA